MNPRSNLRARRFRSLALVLCCGLLGLSGCSRRPPSNEEPPPEALLHGVRAKFFRGSERVASATAAQLVYQRSSGEFHADEVYLNFDSHDAGTGPLSGGVEVRAMSAHGHLASQRTVLEGDVRMSSGAGTRGRTERAVHDGVAGTVSGDVPMTLRGPGYQLQAEGGFHFDVTSEQADFSGPVSTRVGGEP